MFIWDGALRDVSSKDEDWIHDSIRVFEGEYTDPGDLDKIVDTCLGLWATAYYTHRIIVGAGVITPQSEHKSSFRRSSNYTAHIIEGLRPSKGTGSIFKPWRSRRNCAKTHPDVESETAVPSQQFPRLKETHSSASTSSTSSAVSSPRPARRKTAAFSMQDVADSCDPGSTSGLASSAYEHAPSTLTATAQPPSTHPAFSPRGQYAAPAPAPMSTDNPLPDDDQARGHIQNEMRRLKMRGACMKSLPASVVPMVSTPTASPSDSRSIHTPSDENQASVDLRLVAFAAAQEYCPASSEPGEARFAGEPAMDARSSNKATSFTKVQRHSTGELITIPAYGWHRSPHHSSKKPDPETWRSGRVSERVSECVSGRASDGSSCSGQNDTAPGVEDSGSSSGTLKALARRTRSRVSITTLGLVNRVSWRRTDVSSSTGRRQSFERSQSQTRVAFAELRGRASRIAEPRRRKITKEVMATEVALKSSNTIYDIVSRQKKEVFPAKYFGNLVELLEACIDDSKVVPILRSQRNAKLVEMRLNRGPPAVNLTLPNGRRRLSRFVARSASSTSMGGRVAST